jgi:hypothetical protein
MCAGNDEHLYGRRIRRNGHNWWNRWHRNSGSLQRRSCGASALWVRTAPTAAPTSVRNLRMQERMQTPAANLGGLASPHLRRWREQPGNLDPSIRPRRRRSEYPEHRGDQRNGAIRACFQCRRSRCEVERRTVSSQSELLPRHALGRPGRKSPPRSFGYSWRRIRFGGWLRQRRTAAGLGRVLKHPIAVVGLGSRE